MDVTGTSTTPLLTTWPANVSTEEFLRFYFLMICWGAFCCRGSWWDPWRFLTLGITIARHILRMVSGPLDLCIGLHVTLLLGYTGTHHQKHRYARCMIVTIWIFSQLWEGYVGLASVVHPGPGRRVCLLVAALNDGLIIMTLRLLPHVAEPRCRWISCIIIWTLLWQLLAGGVWVGKFTQVDQIIEKRFELSESCC